jgi:hypothetical protein
MDANQSRTSRHLVKASVDDREVLARINPSESTSNAHGQTCLGSYAAKRPDERQGSSGLCFDLARANG